MNRIDVDLDLKAILCIFMLSIFLFPNSLYLFACVVTFLLIFYHLQQKNKPGVFTFIMGHHMLQIVAGVLLCNFLGEKIGFRSPHTATATLASCVGLLFLFLPIIYFQNKIPPVSVPKLKLFAGKLSTDRVMRCYIISFFVISFLSAIAFSNPGLTQTIISLMKVKWFFFLLFGFLCILKNERRKLFYTFIVFEFLSGFFSYFSDFKIVIYFTIIMLLSLTERITFRQFLLAGIVTAGLALFAVFWTSIKSDYRSFLNAGQSSQSVQVSREEALDKLYDLSNNAGSATNNSTVIQTLERIQYTYHLALTMDRVPAILPHTSGQNWIDNIAFATTPRFLNPDKPIYEATEKTKKYTGKQYAGFKQGTSFSLGYFAECYIDFGMFGMMIPLLLLGFLQGATYFYFIKNASTNLIFNYAVVGAFFLEFYAFEMDGTYFIGRFLSSFVTFILLIKGFFPFLLRYISTEKENNVAFSFGTN